MDTIFNRQVFKVTELGTRLKEARIAKGYSLEDLQDITKIQKRYLAGIENGNFNIMPGPFYVRAFIKQYAEAVNLNADEMLELYKSEVPESMVEQEKSISSTPIRSRNISRSSSRLTEIIPKIIVALFIIAIITIAWILLQNKAGSNLPDEALKDNPTTLEENNVVQPNVPKDETKQPAEEVPPVDEPVVTTPEEPVQALTFESTEGQTSTYTLTGTDVFNLKIEGTGRSWISVKDQNGKEMHQGEVNAGENLTYDMTDQTKIRVRIGSTPGVTLYVNDEPLEYAVSPNEKAGITQNIVIQFTKGQ